MWWASTFVRWAASNRRTPALRGRAAMWRRTSRGRRRIVAAIVRRHIVAGTPGAVGDDIGVTVIPGPVVRAVVVRPVGRAVIFPRCHDASHAQRGQQTTGEKPAAETSHGRPHCGTCLLNVSGHSSRPTAAPMVSATTASLPPWRSGLGDTRTRPPDACALAADCSASMTRT